MTPPRAESSLPDYWLRALPRDSAIPLVLSAPRVFVRTYRWWLVTLVLGASADVFTTLWNLREYGTSVEVHIVQRWIDQLIGVEAGVPFAKAMQVASVVIVAAWWRPWCRWILLICGCLYGLAGVSNYFLWM